MAERQPSLPPSDPQSSALKTQPQALPSASERPVRIQLFVALLLGLVLVATSLYLWRRPSARADAASSDDSTATGNKAAGGDSGAGAASLSAEAGNAWAAATGPAVIDAGSPNALSLSEPRIVACKDKGGKKTAADDCDHPTEVEQAIAHAIEEAASCLPTSAGGGTIEYQADVSFSKKKSPVKVGVAKKGGSLRNAKALSACGKAVKHAMADFSIEGVSHEHARYTIAITATYPGPLRSDAQSAR